MKSAPKLTASSASSHRVMPQTFIRTAIDTLRFGPRQRRTQRFEFWARMAIAQQALADQKSARAGAVEPADIFGRIDATFRDHQRRTAIASLIILEQPLGDGDICHEGMQVAIVDPDDFRTGAIG